MDSGVRRSKVKVTVTLEPKTLNTLTSIVSDMKLVGWEWGE